MQLLASLTSPYARKIRVILHEKKLPFELVVDSPWEALTRVPDVNPLGKVPVLVCDNGEAFFDSPVIAEYLETLHTAPNLLPLDPLARVRVRMTEALADGINDAAVTALLESRRPDGERSAAVTARQMEKVGRSLDRLEQRCADRTWLDGDEISLGDISVGIALGYLDLRFPSLGWRQDRPALTAFAERLFQRPSFVDTVPPAG